MSICGVFVFCCTAAAISEKAPGYRILHLHSQSSASTWGLRVQSGAHSDAKVAGTLENFFTLPGSGMGEPLTAAGARAHAALSEVLWCRTLQAT